MQKKSIDLSSLSLYDIRKEYVRRVGGISRNDDSLPNTCIIINNNIVFEDPNLNELAKIEEFIEQLKNS